MRHYEIMLLIHPERSDQVPTMVQRYTQLIQAANGVVHRFENLGRRMLAYPINKLNKACYVLLNVECLSEVQQELKDNVAFNDAILRCLSIRQTSAITEPSILQGIKSEVPSEAAELSDTADGKKEEGGAAEALQAKPVSKKRKRRTEIDIKDEAIDYKNIEFLGLCITETKKMARRHITRANAKQQHQLSQAIKRARFVGLLPHCDKYEQPEMH
jgi:small subunit ribosomal protein S6